MLRWVAARIQSPAAREPWWITGLLTLELMSGFMLAGWGGYALALVDFTMQPAYHVLTRWIGGTWWAAGALAGGLVQIAAAALDLRPTRWCVSDGAMLFWSLIVVGLLHSGMVGPGLVLHVGMALANVPAVLLLRPRWR